MNTINFDAFFALFDFRGFCVSVLLKVEVTQTSDRRSIAPRRLRMQRIGRPQRHVIASVALSLLFTWAAGGAAVAQSAAALAFPWSDEWWTTVAAPLECDSWPDASNAALVHVARIPRSAALVQDQAFPALSGLRQMLPTISLEGIFGRNASLMPNRISPGMAIAVGGRQLSYRLYAGTFSYDPDSARVGPGTSYDLASLSKIVACTTATALLYQAGLLDLDQRVSSVALLGPSFAASDARKAQITVRQLLSHSAGFPPDPTPCWFNEVGFECPETLSTFLPRLTFSCVDRIYQHVVARQTLDYTPGTSFVYSDLSMITLMFVLGSIVRSRAVASGVTSMRAECVGPAASGVNASAVLSPAQLVVCYYDAFVYQNVTAVAAKTALTPNVRRVAAATAATWARAEDFTSAGGPRCNGSGDDAIEGGTVPVGYLPGDSSQTPPQWFDSDYRHRMIAGFVSDENAFALGGISGHAGYFGTLAHVEAIVRLWLPANGGVTTAAVRLSNDTVATFGRIANASVSERALGWDVSTGGCGTMPQLTTLTHTGFTGGRICLDVIGGRYVILLSNAKFMEKRNPRMIPFQAAVATAAHRLMRQEPILLASGGSSYYTRLVTLALDNAAQWLPPSADVASPSLTTITMMIIASVAACIASCGLGAAGKMKFDTTRRNRSRRELEEQVEALR